MKKLFLLGACLWALAGRAQAQTVVPDIVIVRIAEGPGVANVVITRGVGRSEKMEFKTGAASKEIVQSSENYYKILQGIYQEGYALQGTSTNSGGLCSDIDFYKEVKVNVCLCGS